jgi:hypothetical protein
MYYSYVEIEDVATSFSPTRTDLALKLLNLCCTTINHLGNSRKEKNTPEEEDVEEDA